MRKLKITLLAILWCVAITTAFGQKVCQADFYVLPWTFRIEGEITDSLVRHYEGYTESFSITDSTLLQEFGAVTSLPTLRVDNISKRKFTPRVVVDVWLQRPAGSKGKSPYKKTLMLNEAQQIIFGQTRYHKSDLFISWLKEKEITK